MAHYLDSNFAAFHPAAASSTPEVREVVLNIAEREVVALAPPPAPLPDGSPSPEMPDYETRLKDAILFVGRYLWDTRGYLSGTSLSGVASKSYDASGAAIRQIVSDVMGPYAAAGSSRMRTVAIERA